MNHCAQLIQTNSCPGDAQTRFNNEVARLKNCPADLDDPTCVPGQFSSAIWFHATQKVCCHWCAQQDYTNKQANLQLIEVRQRTKRNMNALKSDLVEMAQLSGPFNTAASWDCG